jgi:hypothetical protein
MMMEESQKDNDDVCAICLNELDESVLSLKCKHKFHEDCVLEWRKKSQTCPLCRNDVKPKNLVDLDTQLDEEHQQILPQFMISGTTETTESLEGGEGFNFQLEDQNYLLPDEFFAQLVYVNIYQRGDGEFIAVTPNTDYSIMYWTILDQQAVNNLNNLNSVNA